MAIVVSHLSRASAAGDAAAGAEAIRWDELVATVHRQMRTIAGPSRDLEDLTQSALEQVLRSIDRFESRGELSTYTYKVCVHVALNHWRWWKRWLRRFDFGGADDPRDGSSSPSDITLERERARCLHAALGRLAPMKRVVVTLADLEELPASRIAEIIGCPEPTVRSRLRIARVELAALLADDPAFGDSPGAEGDEP